MSAREVYSAAGFGADLRMSAKLPIAALAAMGILLGAVAQAFGLYPAAGLVVPLLELLAGVGWLVARGRPKAGAWLIVLAFLSLVLLIHGWLRLPGALVLLTIPTALAAALIGVRAAGLLAAAETVLLILLAARGVAGLTYPAAGLALVGLWLIVAVMGIVYQPVYHLVGWSWEHFCHAQEMLEEARDRRGELRQALQDLATANQQLTRLNHLAQGLRQAAEEARLAKEQFVANVSHELRTPLNMIIGFSEMITQAPQTYGDALPPSLLADLEVILRNSQHLSSLIDDVLDLSQVEAGRMALTKERVSLAEIVTEATTAVRPLFATKRLGLEINLEADLPTILCDRTRIREVILNLLSNAGRFTEQGEVTLRARKDGSDVMVSVADTGPGISSEDMGRIFHPFQQLDASIRRRHGGTGLGLSISRSFVDLHGGRMWLESRQGSGTTFYFRLPIEPPMPMSSDAVSRWFGPYVQHEARANRPASAPPLRPRFLLLDPAGALQRLLRRYLDAAELISVASLQEARQELECVPAQALLVNAASVCESLQQLLQDGSLPDGTPALICSIPGIAEIAVSLGAADYLVKPISREALLSTLERLKPNAETVLVVDDEPEALQLFRRMLSSTGRHYRALRASDGRQALDILRRQRPDVLLVDLVMPQMDGFQLLAAKNEDPALRDIPAVVISARDPTGQPILSDALVVTRGGGLSASQLLACLEAVTRILSPVAPAAGPTRTAGPAG